MKLHAVRLETNSHFLPTKSGPAAALQARVVWVEVKVTHIETIERRKSLARDLYFDDAGEEGATGSGRGEVGVMEGAADKAQSEEAFNAGVEHREDTKDCEGNAYVGYDVRGKIHGV